jgi:putative PIN family toxin of toxin-antitoxin system
MRVVANNNVVVSGLLWNGPARQLLNAAREGKVELYSSGALLADLEDVLQRKKFSKELADAQLEPRELVTGYAALATVVQPGPISPIVLRDPDDDAVIACAMTATARYIISGDGDLLALKKHNEIEILKVAEFLRRFG